MGCSGMARKLVSHCSTGEGHRAVQHHKRKCGCLEQLEWLFLRKRAMFNVCVHIQAVVMSYSSFSPCDLFIGAKYLVGVPPGSLPNVVLHPLICSHAPTPFG